MAPRFSMRTLVLTVLVAAVATGLIMQEIRVQNLQQQLTSQHDRQQILLFRDPSQPRRICACVGGKYVFFGGDALIACRNARLHAATDGTRLIVDVGERRLACNTLSVDTASGTTVVDDPQFFEGLGIDFDVAGK